jgi:flagellar FliJ protein
MKRFRFNLEKLLELRKYDEQNWEIKLGQIVSKCSAMEHRIRDIKSDKSKAFLKYNLEESGIEILQISEIYLQRLSSEISIAEVKLDGYISEKQEIQSKFIEVSNKRKILDKLKDKEEAAYYKAMIVAEIKEIDDISIGIVLRNRIRKAASA